MTNYNVETVKASINIHLCLLTNLLQVQAYGQSRVRD